MRTFLDDNFLLQSETAQKLYNTFSGSLPIIDYHNHLSPEQVANDTQFQNISQVWLNDDHYKWRAMRTHGIAEEYVTGEASDKEKFLRWAETVPFTMRNPLYHWTHLELQRYFGITDLLSPKTAERIYEETAEKLRQPQYSARGLLEKMKVEVVCTTDDPVDSLSFHQQFLRQNHSLRMLPTFRPDKAIDVGDTDAFNSYVDRIEEAANITIDSYPSYLSALKSRHDYFAANGCSISDHGLEHIYAEEYTEEEVARFFLNIRSRKEVSYTDQLKFKSAVLFQFAQWDHEKGWVQQYHLGALRNNNARMLRLSGPDTGWDSIGDFNQAKALSKFLNKLDDQNCLAKTIIYNLNPAHNELMATMVGNFNDGSIRGKVQWGSAWWFLDQKDGMTKQINTLSNMGLLSSFVGMLTDSRSFLSFPRHEYFRRLVCNLFGEDIEKGELPDDLAWIGKIISDISYYNAKEYFRF